VTPLDKLGVPKYYELVIIAGESTLEDGKKVDKIRRFLAGLAEGTADAKADPQLAAQVVFNADKSQNKEAVAAATRITLPVLGAQAAGKPFGHIDDQTWQTYADWMRDNGLLENAPEPGAAYDNGLLPPVSSG
jgi:putative hydroxymethylpyrimidine transport system substrate-binding protein